MQRAVTRMSLRVCAAQLTPWGYRPCWDDSIWGVQSRTALWEGWGSSFGSAYLAVVGCHVLG